MAEANRPSATTGGRRRRERLTADGKVPAAVAEKQDTLKGSLKTCHDSHP